LQHVKILAAVSVFILNMWAAAFAMPAWLENAVRDAAAVSVPGEATAVTLYRVADIEISDGGKATTRMQSAVKILTRDGLEFATLTQPLYPFLKAKDLRGWVIKPDGSERKVEKSEIVTVGGQGSAGYYDDSQVLIARPSNVAPGDIVAFEMELEEKGWTSFIQSFAFQIQQPVKFTRFSVEVPESWDVAYGTWRAEDIGFEHEGRRYIWTAYDLEYQPEEPLAPSWYYLSRRLFFSCFDPGEPGGTFFADWPSVARWCADVYEEPSAGGAEVTAKALELVGSTTNTDARIKAIAEFMQKEIRYVAVEIGKQRWQPRPAATTLFNRYGDCKDKSVLMVSMLETAGLKAVPVLCNPAYPVDPRVPTPFQFNHCIVGIRVKDLDLPAEFQDAVVGDWLIFDPTDESTRIGQLPPGLQGDRALLAIESDSVLVALPYPDPEDFRRVYRGTLELGADGSFSGLVTITDFGGLAGTSGYMRSVTSEKEQTDGWVGAMSKTVPSVRIDAYETGQAGDSAWVSFAVKGDHYLQETGGLSLLRADVFHGSSPPRLTAHQRKFPVWFGSPREIVSDVDWIFPPGWVAEADTVQVEHECASASVSSRMTLKGNGIRTVTAYRQDGRLIPPEDYESARRFDHDLSQVRGRIVMVNKLADGEQDD
jgi:transglutaminase-like putative cysteine protease